MDALSHHPARGLRRRAHTERDAGVAGKRSGDAARSTTITEDLLRGAASVNHPERAKACARVSLTPALRTGLDKKPFIFPSTIYDAACARRPQDQPVRSRAVTTLPVQVR